MLLHFTFWEPAFIGNYRNTGKKGFPSDPDEILVCFIGFAEDVGHSYTFKVFNEETGEILYHSSLRKVNRETDVRNVPPYDPHPKADLDDDSIEEVVKNKISPSNLVTTGMFEPDELIGRSFLMQPLADGTRSRATILGYETLDDDLEIGEVDPMEEFEKGLEDQTLRTRFKVKVGSTGLEKYVECNEMCDFIEEQVQNDDQTWRFRRIIGHKRGLKARDKPEVQILWESGEITYEPITEFHKDEPYVLAEYALEKGLIDDWEKRCPRLKLRRHAKNAKKMM